MQTYVALLRGINVGGRIVKMADLKACFEAAGFCQVSTLLQSGNVVFTSKLADTEAVRTQLETAVVDQFNFPAKIMVLKQSALHPLVDNYPFDSSDADYQHYLIFLRPGLAQQLADLGANLDPKLEKVAAGTNVVYWKVQKGMTLKSTFAKNLTTPDFKDFHTNRNLNTVRKLLAVSA